MTPITLEMEPSMFYDVHTDNSVFLIDVLAVIVSSNTDIYFLPVEYNELDRK